MGLGRSLASFVIALSALSASSVALAQTQIATPPAVQELAGQHPAEYYKRAGELLQAGQNDEAVFVFYLGQLRYRTFLLANPASDPNAHPNADPTLFATLSQVTGKPINQYAFGDIPALARTIDAVLAYDTANPDTFGTTAASAASHASVRDGLVAMKTKMLADADRIKGDRAKKGLENR
jgi:hypothetical protein